MQKTRGLRKDARVMAPLGDVLYPGIVVEPRKNEPVGEGMICVELTPPVKVAPPYDFIHRITCPMNRVTIGWF
jgi:hypothetical protein